MSIYCAQNNNHMRISWGGIMPTRVVSINGHALTLDARPDRLDLRDFPIGQWQDYFWNGAVPNGFAESGQANPSGNLSADSETGECWAMQNQVHAWLFRQFRGHRQQHAAHDLKKIVKDLKY